MKAADRERRDARVVQLFLGGASYRSIAAVVGLRSPQSVGNIVQRAMGAAKDRRDLLTDEAMAVWQERTERLFRAHWGAALDGNYRSAEVCRKILAHQAVVYGLGKQVTVAARSREALGHIEPVESEQDELARLRYNRAMGLPPDTRYDAS